MKKILILCTGNSCRSQIAHGYFAYFGKDALDVYSAGIETHGVNNRAIATMEEDGIDISEHTSNHVDEYLHIPFDYILTVCDHANEHCPYIPSQTALRIHHNFTDPSKQVSSTRLISANIACLVGVFLELVLEALFNSISRIRLPLK